MKSIGAQRRILVPSACHNGLNKGRRARPFGAHREGERLTGGVTRPGESEHAPPLPAADLSDDVPGGAAAAYADRRA